MYESANSFDAADWKTNPGISSSGRGKTCLHCRRSAATGSARCAPSVFRLICTVQNDWAKQLRAFSG